MKGQQMLSVLRFALPGDLDVLIASRFLPEQDQIFFLCVIYASALIIRPETVYSKL
jgi:hypothetical protein